MHAVKLLSGPSLALSGVIILSKVVSLSGPSLFVFCLFFSGFKRLLGTLSYHFVCVCVFLFLCPLIWQFSKNSVFQKSWCIFSNPLFKF